MLEVGLEAQMSKANVRANVLGRQLIREDQPIDFRIPSAGFDEYLDPFRPGAEPLDKKNERPCFAHLCPKGYRPLPAGEKPIVETRLWRCCDEAAIVVDHASYRGAPAVQVVVLNAERRRDLVAA